MNGVIKFRAWQDDKMYYQKRSGVYGTKGFFDTLYEDCELMQFTGLHDKNGVEIYEGDVVSSEAWNPKTYQVLFEDGSFGFKNKGDDYLNSLHYLEKFQVIGNIYESPSQIKEGK